MSCRHSCYMENQSNSELPQPNPNWTSCPCFHHIAPWQLQLSSLRTSKLSYRNKLQRVQNSAARLIARKRKFDHISDTLNELHWLSVENRIIYKILLLIYKCLNGLSPIYLTELIKVYMPSRPLQSASKLQLVVQSSSTSYGKRAFSVAAPNLWNNLPLHIRHAASLSTFKSLVKTHLFMSQ